MLRLLSIPLALLILLAAAMAWSGSTKHDRADFVFVNRGNVFIGQAAHCSGTGDSTETDGCTSKSLPEGTKVAHVFPDSGLN